MQNAFCNCKFCKARMPNPKAFALLKHINQHKFKVVAKGTYSEMIEALKPLKSELGRRGRRVYKVRYAPELKIGKETGIA